MKLTFPGLNAKKSLNSKSNPRNHFVYVLIAVMSLVTFVETLPAAAGSSRTFYNISRSKLNCLKSYRNGQGYVRSTGYNRGTVKAYKHRYLWFRNVHGASANYYYNQSQKKLILAITWRHRFVSEQLVWNTMGEGIRNCR